MNAKSLQDAAALMTVAANTLATTQGKPMDAGTAASLLLGAAQAAGPLINPNISLALALGTVALSAVHAATQTGTGLTHEQLLGLFSADDAAKAADLAAQQAAGAPAPGLPPSTIVPAAAAQGA